jgi:hypothetical protein
MEHHRKRRPVAHLDGPLVLADGDDNEPDGPGHLCAVEARSRWEKYE